MKTPTARKLPSGSWYVRVKVDGQIHNITKETKREAEQEAMAIKSRAKSVSLKSDSVTLSAAIDHYIDSRSAVLSPSTIRGYKGIQSERFKTLMKRKVSNLTQDICQKAVNAEAKLCSGKTLKNAWGFISSVIAEQTGSRYTIRLPQVVANEAAYLTSANLKAFLAALRGNDYEIAVLLGLSGLRRSEIMGIRWEDIDLENDCIYVHGSAVYNEDGKLVHKKTNKNTSSRRRVPFILPQLREAIEKTERRGEYVVVCGPNTINQTVQRICRQNNLPPCTCHGLRKSFASMMLVDLHMPEEVVMQAGGWSDSATMRKIYTQVSNENLTKAGAAYKQFFKDAEK